MESFVEKQWFSSPTEQFFKELGTTISEQV
jgi:hypothetical protein